MRFAQGFLILGTFIRRIFGGLDILDHFRHFFQLKTLDTFIHHSF
jgi:hypothetical protein